VYYTFERTVAVMNVRASFIVGGFKFMKANESIVLIFNEEKMRNSGAFAEIWNRDFPIDQFSPRRKASAWDLINEAT
jgi:hypothetical protein